MSLVARAVCLLGVVLLVLGSVGCATTNDPILVMDPHDVEQNVCGTPREGWLANRWHDFADIFHLGAGLSTENRFTGPGVPSSLGLYVEAPLVNLGALWHAGVTAEIEGRGAGKYPEVRALYGIGPFRRWRIDQGTWQTQGRLTEVNYFKDESRSGGWARRMRDDSFDGYGWLDEPVPGKVVTHSDKEFKEACWWHTLWRGWHKWFYVGGEVAVSEPFFTKLGGTVRAGIDFSEIPDFLLGFFFLDIRKDDVRPEDRRGE